MPEMFPEASVIKSYQAPEVSPGIYETVDPDASQIDLAELFPVGEHGIYAYYGRIGQGKTYAMTADILEALGNGQIVYSNYPLEWGGYDERKSLLAIVGGIIGLRRSYYEFLRSNLHFIEVDEHFHDKLATLTDCIVALDEGYVAFDSYEMAKMSMKKRKNVLHTRHFDRSIWYTTQRPNAVHVTMRAQTNVFYKITKIWARFGIIVFRRQELDLGSDDSVDENEVFSTKLYLGTSKIFNAYNTKYLRYGAKPSQPIGAIIHHVTIRESYSLLYSFFQSRFSPLLGRLKAAQKFDFFELSTVSRKNRLVEVLPLSRIGKREAGSEGASGSEETSGSDAETKSRSHPSEARIPSPEFFSEDVLIRGISGPLNSSLKRIKSIFAMKLW